MKFLFLLVCVVAAMSSSAQSFFKPLPKLQQPFSPRAMRLAPSTGADSIYNVVRPITSIAAYSYPDGVLMAGAGVSYQHVTYTYATQSYYCNWSISGLAWAGGSVAPKTVSTAVSYGIMFGILNNLIMVGPAINNNKLQATIAVGINLNN